MKNAPSYFDWAWADAGRRQRRWDYLINICHGMSQTLWPHAHKHTQ